MSTYPFSRKDNKPGAAPVNKATRSDPAFSKGKLQSSAPNSQCSTYETRQNSRPSAPLRTA